MAPRHPDHHNQTERTDRQERTEPTDGPRRRGRRPRTDAEREQARAERAEKVAGLLSRADAAADQLTTPGRWAAMLDTATRIGRYSLRNQLLITEQAAERGFDPTRVAGYRTWRTLGRQVRKGERGLAIVAPITAKEDQDQADDQEGAEGRRVVAFGIEHVWDISQTDPVDPADTERTGERPQPEAADYAAAIGRLCDQPHHRVTDPEQAAEQLAAIVREQAYAHNPDVDTDAVAYIVLTACRLPAPQPPAPEPGADPETVQAAAEAITTTARTILETIRTDLTSQR